MKFTPALKTKSKREYPATARRPWDGDDGKWEAQRDLWDGETNDWEASWDDDREEDAGSDPWDEGESPWDSEGEYRDEEDIPWDYDEEYRHGQIAKRAPLEEVWGIASAIDIYDCDPGKIRDAQEIRRFVAELCALIEMKRFGETQVVHFGEDEKVAGYSMVQLIETSLISAHFANLTNTVYLDVFSCKPYDPETVRNFARNFFKGGRSNMSVTNRY